MNACRTARHLALALLLLPVGTPAFAQATAAPQTFEPHSGQPGKDVVYPTVHDGAEGVAFVEACVKSSRKNGAWTKLGS